MTSAIGETTAATVATSQLTECIRKTSIEEVEDEDDANMKKRKTLPANGRYILMTKSEYMEDMNCSEKGENEATDAKLAPKAEEKRKKYQSKTDRRGGIDISNECEPTSSRTKVEHLVTDEDERIAIERQEPPEVNNTSRELFDWPIPPSETYRTYDPRLPNELNELLGAMRLTKWQVQSTESYREPFIEEISDAVRIPRPRKEHLGKGRKQPPPFKLPTVDDSMASLDALRRKYEPVRRRPPEPPPIKPQAKGKEKASPYSEEDIPRLTHQWWDAYQDILQGTPEELPPLREVNHEINLIDPNK